MPSSLPARLGAMGLIRSGPDFAELYEMLRRAGRNVDASTAVLRDLMLVTHDIVHHYDVVDFAEEAADYLGLYRVEAPMDQAIGLADTLAAAGREVSAALGFIDRLPEAGPHLREIKRLEHEGDRLLREGLTSLFDGGVDPMIVIRWKDIFERVENGIDACDRVAQLLRGISVRGT